MACTWPCADCTAAPNLFDVITIAIGKISVHPSQQQYKDAITMAAQCGGHPDFFASAGTTDATTLVNHVDRTAAARTAALSNNWSLCIDELDHAGGGGKPGGKAGSSSAKGSARKGGAGKKAKKRK